MTSNEYIVALNDKEANVEEENWELSRVWDIWD